MPINVPNFYPAIPEIIILGMACLILLIGVLSKPKYSGSISYFLTQLTLLALIIVTPIIGKHSAVTFNHSFILDRFAILVKEVVYICGLFSFLYSRRYIQDREIPVSEYYVLGLLSILGMMVLISAYDFLTLFLGLELTSLPIYAMVALQRNSSICSEAGVKYFIIGTMASGMLLYGFSLLYGVTGTIQLIEVALKINLDPKNTVVVMGLVFSVVGIAFKLGAVPFHMWVPDVYEGAPTSVTLFLGSAAKLAALGLAIRLLVDALIPINFYWQELLMIVAILSIGIGNLVAIVQTNIKRMLAYSSIAHIGYMTLGLVAGTKTGLSAATFYMISYAIMTLGAFGFIVILSRAGYEMEYIEDFKGLNSRNPWLAFMMMLIMFSLAGIPPLVGFMAKVSVLEALIEVHLVWLAVYAIVFAIVGAYYYIRVVKVMYFEEPEISASISCPIDMRLAMSANGLAVLVLGIFPGILFELCQKAFV